MQDLYLFNINDILIIVPFLFFLFFAMYGQGKTLFALNGSVLLFFGLICYFDTILPLTAPALVINSGLLRLPGALEIKYSPEPDSLSEMGLGLGLGLSDPLNNMDPINPNSHIHQDFPHHMNPLPAGTSFYRFEESQNSAHRALLTTKLYSIPIYQRGQGLLFLLVALINFYAWRTPESHNTRVIAFGSVTLTLFSFLMETFVYMELSPITMLPVGITFVLNLLFLVRSNFKY